MVEIFERIMRDAEGRIEYHYVIVDYLCRVTGGNLAPADDCAAAHWTGRDDLNARRITEGTLGVIEKGYALLK
jgi:hypothetical protein